MGTQDKYFGREQGPLGDPQIPVALHVLQKDKKKITKKSWCLGQVPENGERSHQTRQTEMKKTCFPLMEKGCGHYCF